MSRLDDADWWWEVALEGIGAALVGAIVLLIVLVAILRSERRRSRRQFMTDECIRLVERARAMFARAFEEHGVDPLIAWDFTADLRVLSRRARDDYPKFARIVSVTADVVFVALSAAHTGKSGREDRYSVQFTADTLQNVQDVLNRWIEKRKFFEKMRADEVSRRAAKITDGDRVFG
jgi:hypothetical protein